VKCAQKVKLSLFREDPDNVSVATDEEIRRLAGKLKRVPLGLTAMRIAYVTDAPGGGRMVISGNKRLRCLKAAYGEDGEVPAEWFQDITAMSEAERHEFRINANISDGSFDAEKLLAQYDTGELAELMSADALQEILDAAETDEAKDGKTDADAVPEAPETPVSKRGEVYICGEHRLMCGDSTSAADVTRLMAGEHGDMLFTSPPYSDMREYNGGKDLSVCNLQKFISVWADFVDYECVNLGIQRKDNEIVQYWDGYIAEAHAAGLKMLAWNVWDKGECGAIAAQAAYIPIRHEWIFVFGREVGELNATVLKKTAGKKQSAFSGQRQRDGTIKKHLRKSTNSRLKKMESVVCAHTEKGAIRKEHPATFPVALPSEYIKAMTDDGEIVLEPFGGSGTTMIAAESLGRKARLMELDPHYCDVIRRRWAEFVHGEGCDWQQLTPKTK
jgi:DNA modification methylase